jgi:uncharacterized protein YqjF (DUF2071 family)
MPGAFRPDTVLGRVEHRPYPVPSGPWVLGMSWRDLLFMHWPLQPAEAEVGTLAMTQQIGLKLPQTAPILHFSKRLDVLAWPPCRVAS